MSSFYTNFDLTGAQSAGLGFLTFASRSLTIEGRSPTFEGKWANLASCGGQFAKNARISLPAAQSRQLPPAGSALRI